MSEPSAVNQVVLLRLHYSAISQDSSCCLDGIIEARLFDDVNILKWLLSTMRKSTAFRRGTPLLMMNVTVKFKQHSVADARLDTISTATA
jgi:hypothetical protein